jgi:hypothetical protein
LNPREVRGTDKHVIQVQAQLVARTRHIRGDQRDMVPVTVIGNPSGAGADFFDAIPEKTHISINFTVGRVPATNLAAGFIGGPSNLLATPPVNTFTLPITNGSAYFRLRF